MLLLIDAGNTRIKWALVEPAPCVIDQLGQWAASGVASRGACQPLADAWRGLNIARVVISNVAGQVMREHLEQAMLRALGPRPVPVEWFASAPQCGGVRNAYRNPAQLGCDRFASAIGAHALFPDQALVVATFGTATTVDAVSADGVFLGGMILPGLGLMAASLAQHTAQLPQVGDAVVVSAPFADNTNDAIVSGCIAAQAGAVERAVAARAPGDVRCILSGGAASMVAPHLGVPCTQIDNLVMIGLQVVATHMTMPC